MNYEQETELAKKYYEECLETLVSKAHDYAQEKDCFSNFKTISLVCNIPVETVFMQFLVVKIARLSELISAKKEAKNESIQDTLKDLSNYSCLMAMYLSSN